MDDLGLADQVTFKGAVNQAELPGIFNASRLFINFSKTALDRAVVEAMACGVPVFSTNPCVAEILPQDLQRLLIVPDDDLDRQVEALHDLLSQDAERLAEIGRTLREIVVQRHSVAGLVDTVLREIGEPQ
jgi:glycosyltransferase involved in cell wall biosynthesis